MAELEIASGKLIVDIRGVDKFFALASRLEVPLEHISSVEVNPAEAHQIWHGLRVGTNLPGVITAGRFLQSGGWAFWDCTIQKARSRSTCTTIPTRES